MGFLCCRAMADAARRSPGHASARSGQDGNKAGHVSAGLGAAGLIGILIEPNTYRAANWTRHTRRAVHLHVASCATLVGAGLWHARRA